MTTKQPDFYFDSGEYLESWANDKNQYHREDGPATIFYSKKGEVLRECYYLFNNYYDSLELLQKDLKTLILS